MTPAGSHVVLDVWREQHQWSRAATRLKQALILWRSVALALAVAGAVLATAATQVGIATPVGRTLALGGATALAVLPVLRTAKLGRDRIEAWTRARSAAEGLKAEAYLFLMKAPPYDGQDAADQLTQRAGAISTDVRDLAGEAAREPVGDRQLPDLPDIDTYLARRVSSQIDGYYRRQAARQQRQLSIFRTVEFGLSLLGALLGAVAAVMELDTVGAWVAVTTTIGAAMTVHIAAARYEHLVISYLSTARELGALARGWSSRPDAERTADAARALVKRCEDVISRENESWMAAWTRNESPDLPAPAGP